MKATSFLILLPLAGLFGGMAPQQVPGDNAALLSEAERLTAELPALYRAGRFDEALASARRALAIREQILGPEHLDTATSLNALGVMLWEMGERRQARETLERALVIRRRQLAPDHTSVGESLANLGSVVLSLGDSRNARQLLEEAVTIFTRAYGRAHPTTLHSMTDLGFAMQKGGALNEAKAIHEQVLVFSEVIGADVEMYTALNNLGGLNLDLGNLTEAKTLFERALRHCEAKFGAEHPWTATTLTNLGGAFKEAGDLRQAKSYFERALALKEKTLSAIHPEIADAAGNVGGILLQLGDHEGARPYFERALAIHEGVYGTGHPSVAQSLNNLAQIYLGCKDFGGAKSLLERALEINERTLGPDHPTTAIMLVNLGFVRMQEGALDHARLLWERALQIREAKLGPDHPATADSLNDLGVLRLAQGDRNAARTQLGRALAIRRQRLGLQHPETQCTLRNFAGILRLEGEIDPAVEHEELALEAEEQLLLSLLTIGAEAEKSLLLSTINGSVHSAVSLHVQAAPASARALRLALTSVLRRKGRILDATVRGLRDAHQSQDSQDRELLDRMKSLRESWAFLLLRPHRTLEPEDRDRRLRELTEDIRRTSAELAERHPAYRLEDSPVSIEAVQARIDHATALVELFEYRPWRPGTGDSATWWEEARYVAYVLHPEGPPRWVDLGLAEPIERAVEQLRRSLAQVQPDVRERARELDDLTMAKIRPLLADAKDLVLSPDGSLQLVPFAALVDEEGRYLVERYSLHYVTSGRDLLRSGDGEASKEAGLLLGDADFDGSLPPSGATGEAKRSASIDSLHLDRIAATGEEVRTVGALLGLPQERIVTGGAATEQAVKRARGPEILHIASHGFFLPDVPANEGTGPVDLQLPRPVPEEPLLRSGLALSGFNRHLQSQSPDDGILTALEVADLDLWGTKLVVLSACETGLGDVRTGQGVFGLRRALALAGSQSQMMSLWQVPDEGTKDLMISWYRQMLRGVPKADALRSIQLAALAGQPLPHTETRLGSRGAQRPEPESSHPLEGSRHPYYWAGWILSGDPGPLQMKRESR